MSNVVDDLLSALFESREDRTNRGEIVRPFGGAEATGDLLVSLEHPEVAFCLVIGERHRRVEEEEEYGIDVVPEPQREIMPWSFLGSSPCRLVPDRRKHLMKSDGIAENHLEFRLHI